MPAPPEPCPIGYQLWWPNIPDSPYWNRHPTGGEGRTVVWRCPACTRRLLIDLIARVEADDDGRLVAFLVEVPEHWRPRSA